MKQTGAMEADVIVFGGGVGGMAAALVAALEGQSVILCEATSQVGGTSATSAGTVWIPGNHQSVAAGFNDSQEQGMAYLDSLLGRDIDRARREAYIATGPEAIDYLAQRSEVKFMPSGRHPDYVEASGAAVTGRALAPLPFDGRELRDEFRRIRAPIGEFLVLGGMMVGKADIGHLLNRFRSVASFWHTVKLVMGYGADRLRYSRGTRLVMGNALVARLYSSLRKAGVRVMFETRLREIMIESGRAAGAWVQQQGQPPQRLRARKGVVLATGGMSHHPALRKQAMPVQLDGLPSLVFGGNRGDGVAAGLQAGAALQGQGMFWQPVSRTGASAQRSGLFPHLFLDRAKPGLIAVNSRGLRFTNEAASYHHFCEGILRSNESVPSLPAWLVCDGAFIQKYGLGLIHPGTTNLQSHVRSGYLVCADTVEALAAKLGINGAGLADSVSRNNRYAVEGFDPDFGKGSAEVNRFNGDPVHTPNPCLGPITQAPFCAMAVWPADAATSQGLATDVDGIVLRADGTPLPGLYACGNDMASVMGTAYPGPGTTLGPALVFGYRIGMHVSRDAMSAKVVALPFASM